jgi:hypothetical protein
MNHRLRSAAACRIPQFFPRPLKSPDCAKFCICIPETFSSANQIGQISVLNAELEVLPEFLVNVAKVVTLHQRTKGGLSTLLARSQMSAFSLKSRRLRNTCKIRRDLWNALSFVKFLFLLAISTHSDIWNSILEDCFALEPASSVAGLYFDTRRSAVSLDDEVGIHEVNRNYGLSFLFADDH